MKSNVKRYMKILAVVLLIVLSISTFSGCGFESGKGTIQTEGKKMFYNPGSGDKVRFNGAAVIEIDPRNYTGEISKIKGYVSIFRDIAIVMYNSVFNQSHTDKFAGSMANAKVTLEPSAVITSVNAKTVSAMNNNNALSGMVATIQGAAIGILIAIWAMGFISQIVNEKFTMETLLKTLMQLLCGIVLIMNSDTIVMAFSGLGSSLIVDAGDTDLGSQFSTFMAEVEKSINSVTAVCIGLETGVIDPIVIGTLYLDLSPFIAIFLLILPLIMQVILAYKIISMLITKMIELTARITFAPIPIAFSAQNGFSQQSISYFRGILACAAQPALMMVGVGCTGIIVDVITGVLGQNASGIIGSIALSLAYLILSSYLGETKRLAQEILAR